MKRAVFVPRTLRDPPARIALPCPSHHEKGNQANDEFNQEEWQRRYAVVGNPQRWRGRELGLSVDSGTDVPSTNRRELRCCERGRGVTIGHRDLAQIFLIAWL